jgi:hypothetical protein
MSEHTSSRQDASSDPAPAEGGCLCGAVRYRLARVRRHVVHCHCSQCRGAAGAPVVTWAMAREENFTIVRGEPAWFVSSDHGKRGFCARCGTQLLFVSTRYPGAVDVTAASFDHPERLVPLRHVFAPERIAWLEISDGLPRHVGDSKSERMP